MYSRHGTISLLDVMMKSQRLEISYRPTSTKISPAFSMCADIPDKARLLSLTKSCSTIMVTWTLHSVE